MEDSILTTIKKMLGIEKDYIQFDTDIVININTAFMTLTQLGLGPKEGFSIKDESATWSSFLTEHKDLEGIKTYIYLKVRLVFDPPQMGYLVDAITKQCTELEWRLNVQVESIKT